MVWTGTADPARAVVLSSWDGTGWTQLARGRGLGTDPLVLEAGLGARHVSGDTVHLLVHGVDPFADDLEHEVTSTLDDPSDHDFTIVHQSDTQYLTQGARQKQSAAERRVWRRMLTASSTWIAENADRRRIAYVAHTGDLVENWLNEEDAANPATARREWALASEAQRTIEESGVVTSTLPGNHDNLQGTDGGGLTSARPSLYNEFFGPDRYRALAGTAAWRSAGAGYHPWRADDASNSYTTFSAGGLDFVAVSLGFGVTRREAAWAASVSGPTRTATGSC